MSAETDSSGGLLSEGLLAADEPPPYQIENASSTGELVLVCDHASNRIPRSLHSLGLSQQTLATHIAWDPGAELVARMLADKLKAPLVLSCYSRLVIDCNRPLISAESIPTHSAGVEIPGNRDVSERDRSLRVAEIFNPYQQTIADLLQQRRKPTALLSIHSFTPNLNGVQRPWQIGVAYFQDPRLARRLCDALQRLPPAGQSQSSGSWQVGFNQPYAIETEFDYTVPTQGEARSLPSAMVEIRQDEIGDPNAAEVWAERLVSAWSAARSVLD